MIKKEGHGVPDKESIRKLLFEDTAMAYIKY